MLRKRNSDAAHQLPGKFRWIGTALLGGLCVAYASNGAEKPPSAPSLPPRFEGIWSGTQGVIWDTTLKPGEKENPPYTPEFAARYQAALAAAAAGKPKADPPAGCLPPGIPRIMASPFPFEIIQKPKTIYIMFEYMSQVQRIFLDGSGPGSLGLATFNGYSEGHWEKNDLVVNTVDLNPISVLDTTHVETSDVLKVEERFRLIGADKMQVTITLDDPKAFVRPWVTLRTYVRKPGEQILPYVCEENNRNPIKPDGTTDFIGAK
jgi:hypothetical protein